MQKPIRVSIDTINNNSVCLYENIRKGDTLLMTVNIFQGSASLDLTGQTMHIVLQKPDGYAVEKIIKNVTGNNFQVAFDLQATLAVGDVKGIIEISDSNGTNITNEFVFEVKENPSSSVIINSQNQIETLQQVINLINSYNANAEYLAEQNTLAVQNKADLQSINSTSEILANRLEVDITNGTNTATRLENDIITGSALDATLKKDIAGGTTVHDLLTTVITDGDNVIAQLQNNANWSLIQQVFFLVNKMSIGTLDDENGDYLIDESNVQFIG